MKADLTLGRKEAKFIFTHQERPGISVEKTIGFMGALSYNGKYYEVLGPVDRSFRDVVENKGYEEDGGVPDAFMINSSHGYSIENQSSLPAWGVCSDSELRIGYCFTNYEVPLTKRTLHLLRMRTLRKPPTSGLKTVRMCTFIIWYSPSM